MGDSTISSGKECLNLLNSRGNLTPQNRIKLLEKLYVQMYDKVSRLEDASEPGVDGYLKKVEAANIYQTKGDFADRDASNIDEHVEQWRRKIGVNDASGGQIIVSEVPVNVSTMPPSGVPEDGEQWIQYEL